jgi:uncharacterized protein (TIGR03437 family)
MSRRTIALRLILFLFLAVGIYAAIVNFTFTVTSASVTTSGTAVSVSGPATLTVSGLSPDTGTFQASGSLANISGGNVTVPFTMILGQGTLTGTMTFPETALVNPGPAAGSTSITSGTGRYAGYTDSNAPASGLTGPLLSGGTLSFSISGTAGATRSYTFTVTNASFTVSGTTVFSGPATLTLAGSSPDTGTFTASGSLTNISGGSVSVPFTVTLGHGTITGAVNFPETVLVNSGPFSASATVTGGTSSYAGYTSSTLAASGTVTGSLLSGGTISFTTSGAVDTGSITPLITYVENSASNVPPGLPNAAIAQGSLFYIKGSNFGPTSGYVVATTFPLQTQIANTSVSITVGGTTVAGIMYYAGCPGTAPCQASAVLPSSTPLGAGTVTVTYNGRTSAPAPITVMQNNIGIFTVSQSGSGDAIATLGYSFVSPTNAALANDTVGFWGTGLGPVTFDETIAAQQFNMTNVPTRAWVGGKQTTVVYQGRNACCTAIDVVYITIPSGVSGCATPVVFEIDGVVSNTTTVPIGATSRTCTPTNPGISESSFGQFIAQGTYASGFVSLIRSVNVSQGASTAPGSATKGDSGSASFEKVTVLPGALGLGAAFDIASYGACTVISYAATQGSAPPLPYVYQPLDAGASIGIGGPNGSKTLTKSTSTDPTTSQKYISYYSAFDTTATYLGAGNYAATGSGGPDVGAFTAHLTLPLSPLVWTDQPTPTASLAIDRTQPFTVHWTGGDPSGYVQITGNGFVITSGADGVGASFTCSARTSDGSFTVPSVVLLGLPASGTVTSGGIGAALPGSLGVSGYSNPDKFSAPGIDAGYFSSSVSYSAQVTYK